MNESKASITAMISAYGRAYHAKYDHPKIFDDYLASQMLTEQEFTSLSKNLVMALPFFAPDQAASCS